MEIEFDLVTNRYLYPDRYIKMIPYFLNINCTSVNNLQTFWFKQIESYKQ
jgi:hypothetical protein